MTPKLSLLMAAGAVALLPACSQMSDMFGGKSASSGRSSTAAAQPQPLANDMVRQVQTKLRDSGYYKQGAVDGLWGSGTEMAVQNFQRDHNLPASGKLNMATLQALNVQPDSTMNDNNPPPPPANPPNYNPNSPNNTNNPR